MLNFFARGEMLKLLLLCCALMFVSARSTSAQTAKREDLATRIRKLVTESGAETVGVAFQDLSTGRKLFINERTNFHAASTMKVPVMLEIFRRVKEKKLSLDGQIAVKNDFTSIADGSHFNVSPADDSEATLYKKIGGTETVRELLRLMITESSNLATNILIELATPPRISELMREYDARDMRVLRGVEDGKAFERGLNNTTTARDLSILLRRIAERRAVSPSASDEMLKILLAQKFNDGIPANLPAGVRVAHKTGSITKIHHDAGIVYLPGRRKPYVLVVLTRGLADEKRAHQLIADISRLVYDEVVDSAGRFAGAGARAPLRSRIVSGRIVEDNERGRHMASKLQARATHNRPAIHTRSIKTVQVVLTLYARRGCDNA